ncbi:helix-turn-helix domain-containing protein [Desulfallas thermosapovorans]|uniref:Excisionase family DNA binding protein n=1 Tax=Desulfallas thermosapovorans DSM 6562 TaxID=1121431 RepID=A0A5S4ZR85_9FIRM|nr:helix-turn-helix domain-containing protein [Desulfallas thermosapovorans]TYO94532.1 excisionase family DNA binding protein [Desulfallas thermosapovorans DSM 6562]
MMEMYTVAEVSKKLRVRKSFVYELIYTRRLKALKLSERRIRIPSTALDEFIEKFSEEDEEEKGNYKAAGK